MNEEEKVIKGEVLEVTEPKEEKVLVEEDEQESVDELLQQVPEENKPQTKLEDLVEQIEEKRVAFAKKAKRINLINRIIFGVVVVIILAAFILMIAFNSGENKVPWVQYVALGVSGGLLVSVIIYTFLMKRVLNKKQTAYINEILTLYGDYLYRGDGYKGYSLNILERYTTEGFQASGIYRDVKKITSRAIYNVNYRDLSFKVAELMAEVPSSQQKRKTIASFIGRFYTAPNKMNLKAPVFVYIKGNAEIVSYPSEIDNLKLVTTAPTYDVLGDPEDAKLVSKKLMDLIRKIHVDEVLLDCTIAFHPGQTNIAINYSQECVDFPYLDPFVDKYIKHYHDDDLINREIMALANEG